MPKVKQSYLDFQEGLDQLTPLWKVHPGAVRDSSNFEISVSSGYEDITGYERFSGQTKPSAATYVILNVTISGSFSDGDTVTGATTAATGVIVVGGVVTGGSQDYLVMTKLTGVFSSSSENLEVSASVEGVASAVGAIEGAANDKLHAEYLALASDAYRSDIGAIPGSGPVRGIMHLGTPAVKYGIRDETAWGTVNLDSGASGSVDGITVNSVEIMSGAVSFDTSLTTTAAAVVTNINANTSSPNYTATSVGPLIKIRALVANTFTVTSSVTTIGTTDVNMSGHEVNAEMYKSTTSGWTFVPLGFELTFTSGGTTEISEGDTITGATSAATAVVTRVMLESGTWAAGSAAGRIIFAVQSGTFQSENLDVGASANLATIAADSSAITMLGGGLFEVVVNNFGGLADDDRIYGIDGKNRGFEFDGTVFCPIDTGMTTDIPTHVSAFVNHLFFSYGGSAQHSGIGSPYAWTPIVGAGELATGSTITGFVEEPGAANSPATATAPAGNATLGIYNASKIHMLHGTSSADWNLVRYRKEVGAFAGSMQQIRTTFFMGDLGITDLQTSQEYGDFQHATYSRKLQTLINSKKSLVQTSCIVRDKNQYRVFFTDGTAIFVTLNRDDEDGIMGMMPITYEDNVECVISYITSSGDEEIFFGSDDGYVYQMEKGNSFDGVAISSFFTTHFDYQKQLRFIKAYKDVTFEAQSDGYAEFTLSFELNYGDSGTAQSTSSVVAAELTESRRWDTGNWDEGNWDSDSLKPAMLELGGSGENLSLTVSKESKYFYPLLFSGAYVDYMVRRRLRNNG